MIAVATDAPTPACDCKVGRSAARYNLDDLDAALQHQRNERDASLRDLAEYVNRRILGAAIERAAGDVLGGEDPLFGALDDGEVVSTVFETLTGGDVSAERRARVRTRLEQAGVDVDAVEADYVTHPTVWNHLRGCLDVDTSSTSTIDRSDATGTVEWARRRCESVVEQTFRRLRSAGVVSVSELDVSVSIRLTCSECEGSYSPLDLLDRGRCECELPDD